MFIGYQRSGHSFLGAILDAHPNVAMGMEVDALNLVRLGYSKYQVYYCLIRNSQIFTEKLQNVWTGYSYAIPGQFQGTYTELRMIGDKKGGKSTLRLENDPHLYDELKRLVNCRIKVIHVIRNPFDNISTMVLRHADDPEQPTRAEILDKVNLYFRKARINEQLRNSGKMDFIDIYQEAFIEDPVSALGNLLDFLELSQNDEYLSACEKAVYPEPHRSRHKVPWTEELKEIVNSEILEIRFLKHYTFDD
jgi:hypothetical protein